MSNIGCDYCIHRNNDYSLRCAAFPDGIPQPIWSGSIVHTTPVFTDNNIQFEFNSNWLNRLEASLVGEHPATKATPEEEAQQAAERRLLEALRVLMDKLRAEVAARLRSGVPVTDEWLNKQFVGLLEPELTDIAVGSLQDTVAALGVDWTENFINAEAAKWARAYTFDLVKGLTETTRPLLQQATSTFFETPGMRIGDLEKLLEPAFGLVRAEAISVTETTRAFSAGKIIVQERLAESGIEMERVWHTRNDELSCPICQPKNGQNEKRWASEYPGGPPAHPRCRCDVSLQIAEEEDKS